MGKGKGSFDHWASRIAVSKVIFELKGEIHEQVARDAFRLAGNKMPGKYLDIYAVQVAVHFANDHPQACTNLSRRAIRLLLVSRSWRTELLWNS